MASTAPDYPDVDRGPHLAAVYMAGCAISFLFVATRLTARYSIAGVGIDDWCMLTTWIVFIPLTIIVSIMCFDGGTRHLAYLSSEPGHVVYVTKLNWIAQPLAIFCLGSGKIAVAFLILRLLNRASVWRRWSLHVASVWTAINTILMIVFTFAQCENPNALWDSRVAATTKCWNPRIQSDFSIYGASVHVLIDFYLAVIPVTLVWKLQTDLRKRIALCALLGCGSITGICAAIKASKLSALTARSDVTWETFSLFLWTGIEIILLIVCGSIPALKPIYALCMGRRPGTYGSRPAGSAPISRKSHTRPRGNSDSETRGIAMAGVMPQSAVACSRISEDDAEHGELQLEYEKMRGVKGIQVTRTVAIEASTQ